MSTSTKKDLKSIGFMGDVSQYVGFAVGKTVAVGDWLGRNTLGHFVRQPCEEATTKVTATVRKDAQNRIVILEERMKRLAEETAARLKEAQSVAAVEKEPETPKSTIVSVRKKSAVKRKNAKASVKKTAKRKVPRASSAQLST
ncbi:MAG: hypothetical protein HQ515_10030 [Phycisphaeraceae bacterium]|nr:hypothetical protein [Phycisphaeraceae bacterium]